MGLGKQAGSSLDSSRPWTGMGHPTPQPVLKDDSGSLALEALGQRRFSKGKRAKKWSKRMGGSSGDREEASLG